MGMDANYFEQIAPIAKPSQIQSAAPVTEEIDVDKYAAFGPASDVKESAEDIRKRTQAEIGTTGETTVDETAAINQMRTNKIQDFREGKHNTLWNKKMKDNDIFAGFTDQAVIAIGAMFVLSRALVKTGFLEAQLIDFGKEWQIIGMVELREVSPIAIGVGMNSDLRI